MADPQVHLVNEVLELGFPEGGNHCDGNKLYPH